MRSVTINLISMFLLVGAEAKAQQFQRFKQTGRGAQSLTEIQRQIQDRYDDLNQGIRDRQIIIPDSPAPANEMPGNKEQVQAETVPAPIFEAREQLKAFERIIGGVRAPIREHPWQVALIYGDVADPVRQPFCGGSLIRSEWVLTAAHCFNGVTRPTEEVETVLGTAYPKQAATGERIKIRAFFRHPSYDPLTKLNDIALLKLVKPARLGRPIQLVPGDVQIPERTSATVSGWGAVFVGGPMTDVLLKADVPVISNAVCNSPEAYNGRIAPTMICAGERDGGIDACQGDSGGPLTTFVNGRAAQIGVVSWGEGCAKKLRYGVYTRVADYMPWITQRISGERPKPPRSRRERAALERLNGERERSHRQVSSQRLGHLGH